MAYPERSGRMGRDGEVTAARRATGRRWTRPLWSLAGGAFLALGALGVPLPVLPTTPFLLLSAACFLRGSPRVHAWMMTNRYFGRYLAEYRAGMGVPARTKTGAIALLWAGIGASTTFFVESWPVRGVLVAIAVAVTAHILMIRTKRHREPVPGEPGASAVRLVAVGDGERPLIERWLRQEHVRRWWGDPEVAARELAARPDAAPSAIIEAGGGKVGLVVWGRPSRDELEAAGLADIDPAALDVDIMIGEPTALYRGIGCEALRLVVAAALSDPAVPYLIAATVVGNDAAVRAFTKAGFRVDREFADPEYGACLLLRRDRGVA